MRYLKPLHKHKYTSKWGKYYLKYYFNLVDFVNRLNYVNTAHIARYLEQVYVKGEILRSVIGKQALQVDLVTLWRCSLFTLLLTLQV